MVPAVLVALATLTVAVTTPTSSLAGDPAPRLLPNIVPERAQNLDVDRVGSKRFLRFSTITANHGLGPIELSSRLNDCDHDGDLTNDRTAIQRVYHDLDGNGFDAGDRIEGDKRVAGCFKWHAIHDHWHFQDYADYQLRKLTTGSTVASRTKVGFCMLDTALDDDVETPLVGTPSVRRYDGDGCRTDDFSGISVGWEDLYSSSLADQDINVTKVPDGKYCLRLNIDPNGRLEETSDADNASTQALKLVGASVTPLARAC